MIVWLAGSTVSNWMPMPTRRSLQATRPSASMSRFEPGIRKRTLIFEPVSSGLVRMAHDAGLEVHPYTFRADALPPGFDNYPELVCWFVDELEVDGLFTDFTDMTLQVLRSIR